MADINKMYTWAIQTCNAPNVGYSQTYRNQRTVNGITYYDCSSFVNYALLAGDFETPGYAPDNNAFTTYTEASVLLSLGWTEVDSSGTYLPGDIGLSTGHTEICYQGGSGQGIFMGAHTDNATLANQVSIGSSSGDATYERSFSRLFRYGAGGAVGYGCSVYVVSALAGNSWVESHINPTVTQYGGTAFGMFQWDGTRRTALLEWLSDNGYADTSPEGQMSYLVYEDDWIGTYDGISSLSDFLYSDSTDIDSLTTAFCNCWERPGTPNLDDRIDFARDAYEYILLNANSSSITTWETEPMYYLDWSQALNNAVLMYRFFSAGGGAGGTSASAKSGLPVWMMTKPWYRR